MQNRIAHWDFLKIWLALMVVAHHAAQAYGPTGGQWLVKDVQSLPWLAPFFFVNAAYLMGTYFFIAGYFSQVSLERKDVSQFIKDKFRRLFVPVLVLSLLVFIPMFGSMDRWRQPWHFYLVEYYVNKPPLAVGHLWFLLTLLFFTLALVLVVRHLPLKLDYRSYYLGIVVTVSGSLTALVRTYWPIDAWTTFLIPIEPAHFVQYITLFFLGYFYKKWNWESQTNIIERSACFVISATLLALSRVWDMGLLMAALSETFFCLSITLWMPTIIQKIYLRSRGFVQLFSANVYGVYLFHLFWVLALQYLLLSLEIPTWTKWLTVTIIGFLGALFTSAVLRKSSHIRKFI